MTMYKVLIPNPRIRSFSASYPHSNPFRLCTGRAPVYTVARAPHRGR